MFIEIDTNNADKIFINIPHENAEKTLPAMAAMLEQNATFIRSGYGSGEVIIKPEIKILLSDEIRTAVGGYNEQQEIIITNKNKEAVINSDFQPLTNELYISNKKQLTKLEQEKQALQRKISVLEDTVKNLEQEIETLNGDED